MRLHLEMYYRRDYFHRTTSLLILLGDALPPILGPIVGEDSFWIQRWVVISVPAFFVTLPIASVRRLSSLAGDSILLAVYRLTVCQLNTSPETRRYP